MNLFEMEGRAARQQTLADSNFEKFRKKTRQELFLDNMEQIISWQELEKNAAFARRTPIHDIRINHASVAA